MGTSTEPSQKVLIEELRKAFEIMGLSERKGASLLYDSLHPESDDDDDRRRFVDSFKKKITRTTTPTLVLQQYLSALQGLDEFKKSDVHLLKTIKSEHLSDELSSELRIISKDIYHLIKLRQK